jgi:hypothetical protein
MGDEKLSDEKIYANPVNVTNVEDCFFYHTIDIPGYGVREGQWDLRNTLNEYLGGVSFKGKRVLEIGTADGFICFHMEKQGAEVIAYDLSPTDDWDIVPFAGYDYRASVQARRDHIKQLNNAFWFCHRIFNSRTKMVYGTAYSIPKEIGVVDTAIFGSVLLHLRDPFRALQNALDLTKEMVIVVEPFGVSPLARFLNYLGKSYLRFLPQPGLCEPKDAWWYLPPSVIRNFIGVLGFEHVTVTYHIQQYGPWGKYRRVPYYTIVGRRTKGSGDYS